MKQRSSWLRRFVIWAGPIAAMAVLVVGGFLYWVLATTQGGRWALVTATMQMGGTVSGVSGSVWQGLQVGHLSLPTQDFSIELTDLDLRVQWNRLLERQLHIENLSVSSLDISLTQADEVKPESEPFSMPVLPVQLRVDRLAVGGFSMSINEEPIPVDVGNLVTSLYLDAEQGQIRLNSLDLGHEQADVQLKADFYVLGLSDPWPFDAEIQAQVHGRGADSMLCVRRYMPTLPHELEATEVVTDSTATRNDNSMSSAGLQVDESCSLDVHVAANGNLQDLVLTIDAAGQGLDLDADARLTPLASFPLKDARLDLTLADESSLHVELDWTPLDVPAQSGQTPVYDRIQGSLRATRLNLGQLVGQSLPSAILTTSGRFEALLRERSELLSSSVELEVAEGSVWNDQPLTGLVKGTVGTTAENVPATGPQDDYPLISEPVPFWQSLLVSDVNIDVRLGNNQVRAGGGFGSPDSRLELDVNAPALSSFWPGIPGGVELLAQVGGAVHEHALTLDGTYTPANSVPDALGQAPAHLQLDVEGGWRTIGTADQQGAVLEGWDGRIRELEARHAGLGLSVTQTPALRFVPGATTADGLWRLGSAQMVMSLDTRPVLQLNHAGSSGGAAGQWATTGQIDQLVVSQALIDDVEQIVSRLPDRADVATQEKRGGVKIRGATNDVTEIVLALDWDLKFDQALSGNFNARHLSGDVMVPSEPPFALGLQSLTLGVTARPTNGGVSQVTADVSVLTADMGRADATLSTRLRATPGGGFAPEVEGTTIDVDAAVDDLGWISLFAGDAMEFGGQVNANVTLTMLADGQWDSNGTINGSNIRIVRIDDGVRLLDGTLEARLENDRVMLERLEFPARLRVEPKEWRTAEWVSTNPDARDGYLRLTGEWRLSDTAGNVDIVLHRYPVLQRADRYAMVSGTLHVDAALPALSITGQVEADAGWIDLDMLGGIPTVDSDVVVIRAGDDPAEIAVPMDISMDIEVDLGPRVYLTGYGVNSGLVGNMRIMMIDNKLTAVGALRTRGGAIEAYGQRLQLRRGTITFQGDIASPILSIEALRTGLAVEAGVRVSGTARRPAIDLVSYPEVSEIEKLSWLLFGHGPDESGGDMALLLSVGTSFLGDGEPFYRKFGIDELSLQSGEIGSAGSILPAESVVSGLNTGASDLERQFISASKGVTQGLTVSVRQALSDAGTVGRVSYRLARGLTAELSVGSVNGLALVYRWFSRNNR